MYERTFLQDIADQNFTKYQVNQHEITSPKVTYFVGVENIILVALHLAVLLR